MSENSVRVFKNTQPPLVPYPPAGGLGRNGVLGLVRNLEEEEPFSFSKKRSPPLPPSPKKMRSPPPPHLTLRHRKARAVFVSTPKWV